MTACKTCGLKAKGMPRPERFEAELKKYDGDCLDCFLGAETVEIDLRPDPDDPRTFALDHKGRP
jgi:hypothetical protein